MAVIIWFFSFSPTSGGENESPVQNPFFKPSEGPDPDTRPIIIRVLRYNATEKTYRFTDHDSKPGTIDDRSFASLDDIPIPDSDGPVVPAMIQVLLGEENERTIEHTRFILPVESVQEIISQYRRYGSPTPVPTEKTPIPTVMPKETAAMHMLVPVTEYVCNNGDFTCTAHFSYISRYDIPVTLRAGPDNYFSLPPENRGQPEIFYPGYQYDVCTVRWPANSTPIVWNLAGDAARADPAEPLQPEIRVEPTEGFVPFSVTCTDTKAGNTRNNPEYTWDLGDGTVRNEPVVTHTYRDPDTYPVSCVVSDRCSTASSKTVSVSAYKAAFTWEPDPEDPLRIRFYDQTSNEPDAWYWVFGEGDVFSLEKNPVYAYPTPGTYQVSLTVHVGSIAKQVVTTVHAG